MKIGLATGLLILRTSNSWSADVWPGATDPLPYGVWFVTGFQPAGESSQYPLDAPLVFFDEPNYSGRFLAINAYGNLHIVFGLDRICRLPSKVRPRPCMGTWANAIRSYKMQSHLSASFIGIGREGRCFFYQFTPNSLTTHPEWGDTQPPFGPIRQMGVDVHGNVVVGPTWAIDDTGAGWFDPYGQSSKCIETANKVVYWDGFPPQGPPPKMRPTTPPRAQSCLPHCEKRLESCTEGCLGDDQCRCLCRNQYGRCQSECTGQPSPPPRHC